MAKLKLGAIADDKPVKLTVELPAAFAWLRLLPNLTIIAPSDRCLATSTFPFPVACNYFSGRGRSLTTGPLTIGTAWITGAFGTSIFSTRLSDL
jgi:hypothetical protein